MTLLSIAMMLIAMTTQASAEEARLLRFPTTNGTDVVFTYAGDLYKAPLAGGEAVRLTSHVGYEMFARFAPDGKTIAFTGQYDGNTEVYTLPVEGGEPKRLTYTSTNSRDDLGDRMGPNNMVLTWNPDGKTVVYRNRIGDGFEGKLWTISKDGGMPKVIELPEGGFCSYSPDGKKLAYNRVMREFRTWKYYRGGMADDIWVYDPQAKKVENITDNVAQDIMPMWIGDEIFFMSDRDLTMNIFVYNTKTRQTEKVTNYTEYDVKFASSNGQLIVFENGGYLYKLDPKTRQTQKINITLTADNVYSRTQVMNVSRKISAVHASANGERVAVTARGEVFDVPAKSGVVKNITRTVAANERNAQWSADGKYIAYIGDVTGESEIWVKPAQGGQPIQLTKNNDTYIRQFVWSPDSKKLIYTDRKNRMVEVDVTAKTKKTIMQNPSSEFRTVVYSPDSKWISYTKPADNTMSVVYVYNLETKKEYAVTESWYNSSSPVFSKDGKFLIFSSERDFNPIYSSTEWNHAYSQMGGIYMTMLSKATASPFLPTDDKVGGEEKKDDKAQVVTVAVDADGLVSRMIKLPLEAGYYRNFYSDGKKVWFGSGRSTKVMDLSTQKVETVADANLTVLASGKKALWSARGSYYITDFPTSKAKLDEKIELKNLMATVDYSQEWPQVFDEVWRGFRDGFYLENMHGVDWKAIKNKYAVLLPYVKHRLDLNYLIGEMIGELACGHAYVNPGERPDIERISMGLLGAELSKDKSGYYKIDKILPGAVYSETLRSPLTEVGMDVKEGDYIVAIDGVPTNTVDNIYQLLIGKANVLTELSINRTATDNGAHAVVVKPITSEAPLYHFNWVQDNIKKVEKATNGRVGYVYIPDMGVEGLNEFARYFYPQLDKEALIIDDRGNGGGNVSPMIIERLLREPYRMNMSRSSDKVRTIPNETMAGPKVLLINKYSASDGDLFPWGFQANKIGKLIGTRTWGGIIGIGGSLPYMDGTDVRVPGSTSYDAKTGKWIIENHGVDPDILIDNDPIKEQQGIDEQLNKAIEVILEELKTWKPLPGTPAPRTYKDLGL